MVLQHNKLLRLHQKRFFIAQQIAEITNGEFDYAITEISSNCIGTTSLCFLLFYIFFLAIGNGEFDYAKTEIHGNQEDKNIESGDNFNNGQIGNDFFSKLNKIYI